MVTKAAELFTLFPRPQVMGPLLKNDEYGRSALFLAALSGNKNTFENVMEAMMADVVSSATSGFAVRSV